MCCGNSHSGALGSRVDGTATLVREAASSGLAAGSLSGATAGGLLFALLGSLTTLILLSDGLGVLLVLVHSPVEDVVVLEAFADEQITEDLAEIGVRLVGSEMCIRDSLYTVQSKT